MTDRPLYGLVCVGGGAHGAYQVGVLKYIHEHFCLGDRSPFQVYTGCSCGSINTAFYASESYHARKSYKRLEELWLEFHVPEYQGGILKNASRSLYKIFREQGSRRGSLWSLLDPTPMEEAIAKGFIRKNLEKCLDSGSTMGFGVVATELLSGRCCWFTEGRNAQKWNLFHSISRIERIVHDHIAASCSIPIFLPPVKLGERYYLDGSVSLERPMAAAMAMGATRILAIATDMADPDDLPSYPPNYAPRLSNVVRMLLNRLAGDKLQADTTQIESLNRFYEALSKKDREIADSDKSFPLYHEESMPAHYNPTTVLQIYPSVRIRELSFEAEFSREKTKRKTTRFMFDRKFIRQLIGLGYHDALNQHTDLVNFFKSDERRGLFSFLRRRPSESED